MTESSWCENLPTQPRIWDPSRLSPAMECWRKHYYQTIRGLRRNGDPSVHLEWGKAYHAAVECFDMQLLQGFKREEAALSAKHLAHMHSWAFDLGQAKWGEYLELFQCTSPLLRPHKKRPGEMVKNHARCSYAKEPVFEISLGHGGKCQNCGYDVISVRRWIDYHPKKTRENLLKAVEAYCNQEELVQPYRFPDGTPSVEIQARLPLPLASPDYNSVVDERIPYELLTNIDSIVSWKNELAVRERKTTGVAKLDARYWRQFELNPQIDSYDLAASVLYADPDTGKPPKIMVEATRISAKGEVEIVRQLIHIPEERREEWLRELQIVILDAELAACAVQEGGDPEKVYPRNTKACHGQHGTCAFFALCTAPSSEREGVIASDYHVERWDPLAAESFVEETE